MPNAGANPFPHQDLAPATAVRHLLRRARKAALSTIDRQSGYPYASLVAMATEPDGAPILLLSKLALHTKNIEGDARASLLIEEGSGRGDPLTGSRVTLTGRVQPALSNTARRRFLAVHPTAAGYAHFADFSFFVLHLERAHFVGGFGRIFPLDRGDILIGTSATEDLVSTEPELIASINRDEAERIGRLAERLCGGRSGAWRLTGIDPHGCDLALGAERLRLDFPEPATTADTARRMLSDILERE
ncbi:MAG TPA: pyridoxamine 5'-phosphate oxidase family protein [Hyphomicrobiaceae bacterium]